ncbi:hypothetical protein [Amycolatopsis cihanbeyliensis]|uniref:Uncharacterized protein n=1 Tax=Amycolatopsis cihanbeyliensis TaxID=1128664 RepID=A0A542DR09_AMYCI|nr:hypothetical protein [Amycolatopsis cihanbeyliensis]TQJ05538.1 hypothetical protein FB471_5375 [Amycolatopsis cihanbeyliensis]
MVRGRPPRSKRPRHRRRRVLLEPSVGGYPGLLFKAFGVVLLLGALGGAAFGVWGGQGGDSERPAERTIPPISEVVEATTTSTSPPTPSPLRRFPGFGDPWAR